MRRLLSLTVIAILTISISTCSDSGTGPDPGNDNDGGNGNGGTSTYSVSVDVTPGDAGSISPSADDIYDEGEEIELQATANEGYIFTGWSGGIESTDNPYSLTVNQDYSVTANFDQKTYDLTINTEGEGTVDEEMLEQQSKEYEHGTVVELTANPAEGYTFVEWQGDVTAPENPTQITIDDPKEVTAVFEKKSYALTINTDGEGAVNEQVVQQKSTDYEYGTVIKLTANPAEGWEFVEWTGANTSSDNPIQVTVDSPKEVTAIFQKKTYTLTVITTGQGSFAKDPDQPEYEYGTNVDLTAYPASGWGFEKWEGDITSTDNPVQLTVDGTKDVTAVFVEQSKPLFYLAENGVTIKCENAQVGDSGTVNGVTYTKRNKSQITPSNAETTCTSGITDMGYLFYDASSFNGDISSWDVSSVTDMGGMFFRASSFNMDISNWDVGSVTDMSFTFAEALAFNKDLSNWDVSSVIDMENMFDAASSFNQPLNGWNVGNVTTMRHMFRKATSFNGDISSWGVGSVTDMRGMFAQATSFNRDINNWNVSNVTIMDYMFASASSFNQSLNNWDVSNVVAIDGMFRRATAFNGDISGWNVGNVEPMDHMFEEADSFNRDIGSWDVSSVTNMENMFNKALSFNQDLSGWCVSNIESYPSSFAAGSPLESSYFPEWGTCP